MRTEARLVDPLLGVELCCEAAALLAPTELRGERARTLLLIGTLQRRAGQRSEARANLAAALDVAAVCGAGALVASATDELRATGARPRRDRLYGTDALTGSEQRVARLAADGATNREIAQRLFVTQKTVETQLSNVYRKLGIGGRAELLNVLRSE